LAALAFLFIVTGSVRPQAPPSPGRQNDEYKISVNVEAVLLHATVRDRKGIPVSGLDRSAFQVYEDGVLQPIQSFRYDDIPVTVGLVVDNSGSMRSKRPEVIAAALAFAGSSNPQDQMFVVNFNEHVSFGLPGNTPFTDQSAQLEIALSSIAARGMTALYDAVAAALDRLKAGDRDKKVLIVISDGGDNASKLTLPQIVAMARKSDAIIYTIGLFDVEDEDRNPHVLAQLSKETGGEAFLPASISETLPICERIARDIRNQYTLTYVPTNRKADGAYRVIELKAEAPGRGRLFARTRSGYYAPSTPPSIADSQGRKP
jgi:VWFA-related protein